MSFIVSQFTIIASMVVLVFVLIYALKLIFKFERGLARLLWVVAAITFFPVVPLIYIIMSHWSAKSHVAVK